MVTERGVTWPRRLFGDPIAPRRKGIGSKRQSAGRLPRFYEEETRTMPSFFILLWSVDGFTPRISAAPPGP